MSVKAITLHTVRGDSKYWLGQIVYTEDGMLAGVTEYGNFAYAWRAFGGNFEDFLLRMDPDYFADKIEGEFLRIPTSRAGARKRASLIATQILRPLQTHIVTARAEAGTDGEV